MKSRIALAFVVLLLAGAAALVWKVNTVRWQDAYRALEVYDSGPEATNLVMAQTLAEGEAPEGLTLGARLHPFGSLMRIRYEELDAAGAPVATHDVRALVPALPYFGADAPGSEFGAIDCRERCRSELAASGAVLISRSGKAGIADEWLLRLPIGRSYPLGRTDLHIQDIGEDRQRNYAQMPMRVTLLETCKATVRIGSASYLDFIAALIPYALHTTQWVQLEGCTEMMNAAPAPEVIDAVSPPAAISVRKAWQDRSDWGAVRPMQSGGRYDAVLAVDRDWPGSRGKSRLFHLVRACRFDRTIEQWVALPKPEGDADVSQPGGPDGVQQLAYRFPQRPALYFAEWTEIEDGTAGPRHRITMPSGTETCRDGTLPPVGPGEVVACVPSSGNGMVADATVVPDPAVGCTDDQAGTAVTAPR